MWSRWQNAAQVLPTPGLHDCPRRHPSLRFASGCVIVNDDGELPPDGQFQLLIAPGSRPWLQAAIVEGHRRSEAEQFLDASDGRPTLEHRAEYPHRQSRVRQGAMVFALCHAKMDGDRFQAMVPYPAETAPRQLERVEHRVRRQVDLFLEHRHGQKTQVETEAVGQQDRVGCAQEIDGTGSTAETGMPRTIAYKRTLTRVASGGMGQHGSTSCSKRAISVPSNRKRTAPNSTIRQETGDRPVVSRSNATKSHQSTRDIASLRQDS